ncbi:MAG: putative molybdenum carrier protein [Verrucomicrobiota bacterium]
MDMAATVMPSPNPTSYATPNPIFLEIISGGQTGADRAGLDFAIARGLPHGGWCPKGRKAEDGPLSARYGLTETPSASYLVRTERNAAESDATVIFTVGSLTGGSKRTAEFAKRHGRPFLHLSLAPGRDGMAAEKLADFIRRHRVVRLNVAGSRESKAPGIHAQACNVLDITLDRLGSPRPALESLQSQTCCRQIKPCSLESSSLES